VSPITGLFAEELDRALSTQGGRRSEADVGVLYIDLDDFKSINDTFGHDAGDEVLLNSAERMRSRLRPHDCVARLGGDEFGICAQRITAEGLAQLAVFAWKLPWPSLTWSTAMISWRAEASVSTSHG
jgi:diguanylate cyclase (GGDEF)-like protein